MSKLDGMILRGYTSEPLEVVLVSDFDTVKKQFDEMLKDQSHPEVKPVHLVIIADRVLA